MCQFCNERKRLTRIIAENPQPCFICGDPRIVGIGTWVPDDRHRLAVGCTSESEAVFAYCLCEAHAEDTEENERLIMQEVVRSVREKKGRNV